MPRPTDHTSAATPAAGGRFVGLRRRVVRTVLGHVTCDQCGTEFEGDECPYCAQRRRNPSAGGLVVGVSIWAGGGNTWSGLDRADDIDGEGWNPDPDRDGDDGGEAGGWPW